MAEQIKNCVKEAFKSDKNIKIFTVIGMGIIGLIFTLTLFPAQTKSPDIVQENSTEEYTSELESKVSDILTSIEGVGATKVMITIENAGEKIYHTEIKSTSDSKLSEDGSENISEQSEENLVIVDGSSGNNEALIKTELPPKIGGIAIICEGGDNVTVINQITQTLKAMFDISSTDISVAKLVDINLDKGENE